MKSFIKTGILQLFFITFLAFANLSFAPEPPPPPAGGHGQTGNESPMGGPVPSGVVVVIAFGAAVAGWEIYKVIRRRREMKSEA